MRGTYTIVLACKGTINVRFGKRGQARLAKGYYLYTGSALGRGAVSLEGRLARHGRRPKKIRWHVDYFTSRRDCTLTAGVYLKSRRSLECTVNRLICDKFDAEAPLPRLGSSDCKCNGHLVRAGSGMSQPDLLNRLKRVYSRFGPASIIFTGV
jgi:sugar fermentation stimulation protein A